jgi:hypothetical protein
MIEFIVVIILMATVGLIIARLFSATMRVVGEAPAAQNAIARAESMLRQLRADAWGATAIASPSPHEAQIRWGDGRSVSWRIGDDVVVRTSDREEAMRWPREPGDGELTFAAERAGNTLYLNVQRVRPSAPAGTNSPAFERVALPSELYVLNRIGRGP